MGERFLAVVKEDVTIEASTETTEKLWRHVTLAALKMEEGGHEPRNVGNLWNLETSWKWSLQKGKQPFGNYFSPVRLLSDF